MAPLLDDLAAAHHEDLISVLYRRQAVSDDHGGSTMHQPLQRHLHQGFASGIEVARRLIEKEDARIF